MKTKAIAIGMLLASSLALADTTPEKPLLIFENGVPVYCGPATYSFAFEVPDATGFSGRVYQRAQCPTGGRGTKPRYFSACADVRWDLNGHIALRWEASTQQYVPEITPVFVSNPGKSGVLPLPVSACLE